MSCGTVSARRGLGTQRANPGAPAAQRHCSPAPSPAIQHPVGHRWGPRGALWKGVVGQEREGTPDKTGPGKTKDDGPATVQRKSGGTPCSAHATRVNHNGAHATCEVHAIRDRQGARHAHTRPMEWWSAGCGRPVQSAEEWGTWASRTEAGGV